MTASAANPVTATKTVRITHTASNNRISWIGLRVVLIYKDGTREECPHTHGHRTTETARACATKLVAQRNKAYWAARGDD
jgi:hypothetical protein